MSLFVGKAAKGAPAEGRKPAFSGILPSYKVFLTGLFACLLASGCGLQDYVYLEPPEAVTDSGGAFHFENNINNDPLVFYGFIVLYRFYNSTDSAATAHGTISSAYSSSPTTIFQKMTSMGYRNLKFIDVAEKVYDELFIEDLTDKITAFQVEIDYSDSENNVFIKFAGTTTVGITPDLTAGDVRVRRNVDSPEHSFASADLIPGAEDLQSGQYSEDGKTYLQCYVLAYGFSMAGGGFEAIYSEPKWFNANYPPEFNISYNP